MKTKREKSTGRNVRIWTWCNQDLVRITLKPGKPFFWTRGGPDEEGWWSASDQWEIDGDLLRWKSIRDGRDCDGRLTHYWEGYCQVSDLKRDVPPAWITLDRRQRDYSAEAMGY